jgi:hypothetical protein
MPITIEGRPVPEQEQKHAAPTLRGVRLWSYSFLPAGFVLLCLLQFHSWISLEQGISPNAQNPLATPFYVVNKGNLLVRKVSGVCEYLTRAGNRIVDVPNLAESLMFEQRQVLPCAMRVSDALSIYRAASFTVTVKYRVGWFPLYRSQTFRLKSAVLADGTYLWFEEK